MTTEHLTPLNQRTKEDARRIQVLGGQTKSPKKSIAQKIARLKKKGLTSESAKDLYDAMVDADLSAVDIYVYLQKIKKNVAESPDPSSMIAIASKMMDWHKMHHGQKVKSENVNLNINVNADIEEAYRQIKGNVIDVSKEKNESEMVKPGQE